MRQTMRPTEYGAMRWRGYKYKNGRKKETMSGCERVLLCLVSLVIGTGVVPLPVLSLTNDLTNDPAKVIDKYLSLDKRGVRLAAHSYESIKPYVAWEQEEPVWKRFVVIRDYAVSDDVTQWDVVSSTEAFIPVTFPGVGRGSRGDRDVRPRAAGAGVVRSYPGRGQSLETGGAGVSPARWSTTSGGFRERCHVS